MLSFRQQNADSLETQQTIISNVILASTTMIMRIFLCIFCFVVEFVLALTGATMGTMIAFIFPSNIYLHVVSEQTHHSRLTAKVKLLILNFDFLCYCITQRNVVQEKSRDEFNPIIHMNSRLFSYSSKKN